VKKRYKIVALIALAIIVGLVINDYTRITTFKEVVFSQLNGEVSSIEIIRSTDTPNEDKITVTDPSQIELIMNALSQTKLREASRPNIKSAEKYWITLKIKNIRKFGITLYGKDYVDIYDDNPYEKDRLKSYKITNKFDPIIIRALFK